MTENYHRVFRVASKCAFKPRLNRGPLRPRTDTGNSFMRWGERYTNRRLPASVRMCGMWKRLSCLVDREWLWWSWFRQIWRAMHSGWPEERILSRRQRDWNWKSWDESSHPSLSRTSDTWSNLCFPEMTRAAKLRSFWMALRLLALPLPYTDRQ